MLTLRRPRLLSVSAVCACALMLGACGGSHNDPPASTQTTAGVPADLLPEGYTVDTDSGAVSDPAKRPVKGADGKPVRVKDGKLVDAGGQPTVLPGVPSGHGAEPSDVVAAPQLTAEQISDKVGYPIIWLGAAFAGAQPTGTPLTDPQSKAAGSYMIQYTTASGKHRRVIATVAASPTPQTKEARLIHARYAKGKPVSTPVGDGRAITVSGAPSLLIASDGDRPLEVVVTGTPDTTVKQLARALSRMR